MGWGSGAPEVSLWPSQTPGRIFFSKVFWVGVKGGGVLGKMLVGIGCLWVREKVPPGGSLNESTLGAPPPLREGCLAFLLAMLGNRFPKVRTRTAQQLYSTLLTYPEHFRSARHPALVMVVRGRNGPWWPWVPLCGCNKRWVFGTGWTKGAQKNAFERIQAMPHCPSQ